MELKEAEILKLDVHLQDDSVWVTQEQMAQLFGKAKSTRNEHINNIYKEGELEKALTTQKFGNSESQQKVITVNNSIRLPVFKDS